MNDRIKSGVERTRAWMNHAAVRLRTRRMRRIGITLVVVLFLYTIGGFFGLPMLLRHILTTQVSASLKRPVTVGKITFNPYRLKLEIDRLHIADSDGTKPFVDLDRLRVKVSWTSLYRLAPVIKELKVDRPAVHVVRTGQQQFNFSDLLVSKSPSPPPPPSKPARFALSNIQLHDGDVRFDDQVLGEQHKLEHIELDLPFIANLPADTDIFVQPLLRMIVDGSPLKIGGRALPFAKQPESVIGLRFDHLNLAPYVGYIPEKLPVKIPQGALSAYLQVHFAQTDAGPVIRINGQTSLDDLDVRDSADAPLAGFKRAVANLNDVEPLTGVFHLGAITVDTLNLQLVRNRDGTTNLTPIMAPQPKTSGTSAPRSPPISDSAPAASPAPVSGGTTLGAVPSPTASAGVVPLVTAANAPAAGTSAPVAAATVPTAAASAKLSTSPAGAASPVASASPAAIASPPAAATNPPTVSVSASAAASPAAIASPPTVTANAPAPSSSTSPPAAGISAPSIAASAPISASPPTPPSNTQKGPLDLTIDSFTLTNSTVKLTDNSLATPATVALQNINIGLKQFALGANASPSAYDFAGSLSGGGSIAVKGNLDLVKSQVTSDVTIDQVDLPSFQAYAQSALAATIGAGKLNAHASILTSFAANQFNLHVEPASFSIDTLAIAVAGGAEKPVQWSQFGATIAQVDLATHQATVSEVHGNGIHLIVQRGRDGKLNLLSLLRSQTEAAPEKPANGPKRRRTARARVTVTRERHAAPRSPRNLARRAAPATPAVPSTPAGPQWQYRVALIVIDKATIDAEDDMASRPLKASLAPLNLSIKNFTSDFHKPFDFEIDGVLNRRGSFKISGPVVIAPLKADLKVNTKRLDLALADSYMPKDLNATIKSAALTVNGAASAAMVRDNLRMSYRGSATLGNVRMLDKVTGDDFVRWNSLSFDRIDFGLGQGLPKVHIGAIALSDFYARIILNSNGQLNLSDITSNPSQAPKSLTRQQGTATEPSAVPAAPPVTPAPSALAPAQTTTTAKVPATPGETGPNAVTTAAGSGTTTAAPAPAAVPKPIGADIALGQITLHGGHVDYSDFFIKPNYRANLTDISGKVGAFGTSTTTPAEVVIAGQINGSAPININGSVNPLAPLAAIDITAKANGIELTDLTAYSVKYTGYPITKGTLTVDVHYTLANQNLTATNHIFLDQLTFGDRVVSSTAKNLPIRLAVAILKDSKGQINLDIPVSGSLNDPQFSLGGIIFHAFMNILEKAITAPFRLLAGAIGGIAGGGSNEDLSYVEFPPGRATLDTASQRRLDSVAAALNARPALKLSITGRVDPTVDKAGLREAKVDDLVRARMNDGEGTTTTADDKIPPDLYNKYLKKVYKAAKFDKPRDMVGLDKSIPPEDMKKLLVTNMDVTDDDEKNLASARAQAVRKYLSTKIDPSRLFTVAPKLDASGIDDKGKTTRAELALQ
jgi:hypothetical protein